MSNSSKVKGKSVFLYIAGLLLGTTDVLFSNYLTSTSRDVIHYLLFLILVLILAVETYNYLKQ
jgi:hypothetical protein